MLKKYLVSIMTVTFLTIMVGCSSNTSQKENKTNNESQQNIETKVKSNTLVAYFSKTGSTEKIAKEIRTLTNGELVKIEPAKAYPENYQETVDIAQKEVDTNARPTINDIDVNINDYDIIYIGYPIWWHDAPMVIYTFMENNDLSGKTIIPFCTSGGSDIEESMQGINNSAKDAMVLNGLTANSTEDVKPWLENIGMLK